MVVGQFEKTLHEKPRSCLVGVAWTFFTPKRYQFGNTLISPFIISSGSIKEKAPQKLPLWTSCCLRNNLRCTSALFHNSEYLEKLSPQLFLWFTYDWNAVPADLDFFHQVHFDEVMHWNVCWIFCFRYEWLPSFLCYYISKISMLETVSLLYSKHFLDRYVQWRKTHTGYTALIQALNKGQTNNTGNSMPYSYREVCGFFNFPC